MLAEQILLVLDNPDGAAQMSRAALGVAMPDAHERLAEMVIGLAEKGQSR